MGKELHIP